MVLDINWECYFTPKIIPGSGYAQGWKKPWELASLNLGGGNDTVPAAYQYVYPQTWTDRSKDLIAYAEVVKTLRFGSTAQLILDVPSDRDIFEVIPNETVSFRTITGATQANPCEITSTNHQLQSGTKIRINGIVGMTQLNDNAYTITSTGANTFTLRNADNTANIDSTSYGAYSSGGFVTYGGGDMLPRMKFPYRVHRINLQAKGDGSMPTNMFVGSLVDYSIQSMSDIKNNNQDGRWRVELNFVSLDHPRGLLGRNKGAPLWHHRANNTTDSYHIAFRSSDALTFDSAITQIVAWMNTSRPTTDFPVTFSYSQKGTDPYSRTIGSNPMGLTGTVTMTNGSTAVSATGGNFEDELEVGQKIKRTVDGQDKWAYISSITNDNNAVLTSNYTGTTGTGVHKIPINDVVTVDGRSTWEVLERLLAYMGAVEALGFKYIPTCSATGTIDVTQGGFAKGFASPEDFRTTQNMYKNVSTDMTIRFNMIGVHFTKNNPADYWIKFTLYKSDGAGGWTTVLNIPSSGYEYVPYDANNTHSWKYYKFPTQEITPEDTYKWDADLVCSDGTFGIVVNADSMAYTPQTYQFLNSPLRVDYSKINSFMITRGACYDGYGGYATAVAAGKSPQGCMDGGLTADGGYQKCTDAGAWGGCYPDPDATPAESVNAVYGIQGAHAKVNTLSALNSWDTVCRLHSKKLYECQLNTSSLVREPLTGTIIFNDGYTSNLVGEYVSVYSPELDDFVMLRVIEQKHIMAGGRMPTTLKVFRV